MFKIKKIIAATFVGTLWCSTILLMSGTWEGVMAHEVSHEQMSEHMKAMYRLKEKIPEEYRVMDRTPLTPTPGSLAKGKALYLQFCSVCHGEGGGGDGPAAAGMKPRPANFLDIGHSSIYGPGEKFWIIGNGSPETGMPGFSSQVNVADRWHLVNYIRFMQAGKSSEAKEY